MKHEHYLAHLFWNPPFCASTVSWCRCCRIHRYVAAPPDSGWFSFWFDWQTIFTESHDLAYVLYNTYNYCYYISRFQIIVTHCPSLMYIQYSYTKKILRKKCSSFCMRKCAKIILIYLWFCTRSLQNFSFLTVYIFLSSNIQYIQVNADLVV